MTRPPPRSTLFPYTTLFRSELVGRTQAVDRRDHEYARVAVEWIREGPGIGELAARSEEHTSELQSLRHLVCRLLLEKKKKRATYITNDTNPAYTNHKHYTDE